MKFGQVKPVYPLFMMCFYRVMARLMVLWLMLALSSVVMSSNIGSTREEITHNSDGGYSKILIAIDESVVEDRQLLTEIQV